MSQQARGNAPPKQSLTVGEVAARAGVAVSALHFYERRGLISSDRSSGNQRRYSRDVLRRVSVIKTAQALGLALDQIAEALAVLPGDHAPGRSDWERMAAHWRADLDQRVVRLLMLREMLSGCIGCGCLSLELCPLRNTGDRLATEGPGPRLMVPDMNREEIQTLLAGIDEVIARMGHSPELVEKRQVGLEPEGQAREIARDEHHTDNNE